MTQLAISKIELEIENMTPKEAAVLRDYFVMLIATGIHKIRNGRLVLYFDNDGLVQIGENKILWRKKCNKKQETPS